MTGRTQRVVVDGESSSEAPVKSGAPQGTVLGPLFFILYINDINADTTSSIRLFADDCLLYRVINTVSDADMLQRDLQQLGKWADIWQMDFNAAKCHLLSVTRKKNPVKYTYSIGGAPLKQVAHHPYLGVELAADLSWGEHIKNVVPRAQRTLNFLRRNLSGCSQGTKEAAYKTLVRPLLEYGSSAWDPYQGNHIGKLEDVQRRAARFVKGQYRRDVSVTKLQEELQWRTLQERRLCARLTMFHKATNGEEVLTLPPTAPPSTGDNRTSHDLQFTQPRARTETYIYSYFPRTIRIWNILPASVVYAPNADIFKSRLHEQFTGKRMYTVTPRGLFDRPRLGSYGCVAAIGPVY